MLFSDPNNKILPESLSISPASISLSPKANIEPILVSESEIIFNAALAKAIPELLILLAVIFRIVSD